MPAFMNDDFLLQSKPARDLYHIYAKDMPVFDYHCHVPPAQIAENRVFSDLTEVWLGGDHYKWRLMRACGVPEKYITGDAPAYEKFEQYAAALPRAIGSPIYHWTHLELARYFGVTEPLCPASAHRIWDICNEKLRQLPVRTIIESSRVKALCTTDDPSDSLEHHKAILDSGFPVKVLPTFRPDRILNSTTAADVDKTCAWLSERMDYFAAVGCKLADHALVNVRFQPGEPETELMLFCAREYARRGWVMQIHYGVCRNVNRRMFELLGADTGYDCISADPCGNSLLWFFDALDKDGALPKVILYSLNPADNAFLVSAAGCFQESGVQGKIQHGSAWWFNDNIKGMTEQLTNLASLGVLGTFIGMLTDSRSFLSYTRHEYFRRILCNLLGGWAENGEVPNDMELLGGIVRDICFNNAARYLDAGI